MLSAVDVWSLLLRAALAFLLGAVPFAWLIVRVFKGVDVRTVGSGNVGATNASRAFDGKARLGVFLAVYLLDAAKGYFGASLGWGAQLASTALADSEPMSSTVIPSTVIPSTVIPSTLGAVVCAAAAILGHVFTPFLGGRGGKGVAAASGALLALDWRITAIALGTFFLVRLATGEVFFGSLALGLGLAGAAIAVDPADAFAERLPVTVLCIGIALFLFWTHRSNLQKFLAAKQS